VSDQPVVPERQLSEAIQAALDVLSGITIETIYELVGVSAESYAAMTPQERTAVWTPDHLLVVYRYLRQQADACEQTARIIRRAADATLEEELLPQLIARTERQTAPIVLAPNRPAAQAALPFIVLEQAKGVH